MQSTLLTEGYIGTVTLFWFMPKIALPKFWIANILVELFLARKLANISQKMK
jgi:hypothetical protein